jgi:hypothetical protein
MKLFSELFEEMLDNDKQPMYVAVRPDYRTIEYLQSVIRRFNIPQPHSGEKMHCTEIYSTKPTKVPQVQPNRIFKAVITSFDVFKSRDGKRVLVAKVESSDLQARHTELMTELEASYDFPDYLPHITLSYDIGDMDETILNKALTHATVYFTNEYYELLNDLA